MTRKYFGTDGIRGRVGEQPINAEFMLKLGWAAGRVLGNGGGARVVIGKDTRISGYMFESALEAGLSAAGVDVRLLGPMPTPAIAYLTRTLGACAGIVISASHNPHYDNGIKFFSAAGTKLPDAIEADIERALDEELVTVPSERLGKAVRIEDARGRYIEYCKSTFPGRRDLRGLKIVVSPDGLNINQDCGSTAPAGLCRTVLAEQADLGIALDGDGDRVLMVDHAGELVDGDELLYIIARARNSAGKLSGPVVGTLMSNLGLELALQAEGIAFLRARVGDRHVMEMLQANAGMLGGESSGHIICLDRTTTGDGIVSALQVLAAMVQGDTTLQALRQGMTRYPQVMINVPLAAPVDVGASQSVRQAVTDVEARLQGKGRVLLRPSGTEPLIRVMVEGEDAVLVRQQAEYLADVVTQTVERQTRSA
jgi:phosphoglucosamine mutase